jgi:hypothetical protein
MIYESNLEIQICRLIYKFVENNLERSFSTNLLNHFLDYSPNLPNFIIFKDPSNWQILHF